MLIDEFKRRYTTLPMAVYRGEYRDLPQDILSLRHQHREMEVLLVRQGRMDFYVGDDRYCASAGDLLVVSPYMLHNARIFASEELLHYCICFDLRMLPIGQLCDPLENGATVITPWISHEDGSAERFSENIREAFLACERQYEGWEMVAVGQLLAFIGRLQKENRFSSVRKEPPHRDFCRRTVEYLEQNYAMNITSADLSAALYLNNSYFCRCFKKNFGCCFREYLAEYRLEKAKLLLCDRERSVSEISSAVGFNSMSYFGKLFRRKYAMSPTEYRRSRLS